VNCLDKLARCFRNFPEMKTSILPVLITFALVCFALVQNTQAISPRPDGGYPDGNTAEGTDALFTLTNGVWNTGLGFQALYHNTTGKHNTATGHQALFSNTTGDRNTANGVNALGSNTTGDRNTANGVHALERNTTGNSNTAFGVLAGFNQTTGSGNVYIGRSVFGVAGESNKTYIRNINITGLNGTAVTVDLNTGLLGHATSSRRYKEEIEPMDKASEALYQLKPVTFRYKKEIDRTQSLSFGLIAEEVAEVNPDLIARDSVGKPETVRHEAVNAMLLNEFLKEHKKTEKLEATVASLIATVKEQAAQIQKVSAQLEASKPAPQVVNNP
jgi:hypothetical protein